MNLFFEPKKMLWFDDTKVKDVTFLKIDDKNHIVD